MLKRVSTLFGFEGRFSETILVSMFSLGKRQGFPFPTRISSMVKKREWESFKELVEGLSRSQRKKVKRIANFLKKQGIAEEMAIAMAYIQLFMNGFVILKGKCPLFSSSAFYPMRSSSLLVVEILRRRAMELVEKNAYPLPKKREGNVRKEMKIKIHERDLYTCQICGAPLRNGGLTIHHIVRRANGGNGYEINLITLCKRCHHDIENRLNKRFNGRKVKLPDDVIGFYEELHHLWALKNPNERMLKEKEIILEELF